MSSAQIDNTIAEGSASERTVDLKLEVVVIAVSDVDRAKKFYGGIGWRLDADFAFDNGFRIVQFTPPGSGCSIQFGTQLTSAAPGSAEGLYLIVSDIEAARQALAGRGVEPSEVFHEESIGARFELGSSGRVAGPAPDHGTYGSFATFVDPDGNRWLLQEITTRLPGRVDPAVTSFASAADLAEALRRASAAHGEHEKRHGGEYDEDWPDWYATYMVAEQAGAELPE
ncbi:MAG TPA: VOC family protein [Gaiellaceae bacterium]|nr:VOC family protein [Gaiellaceae bacterium]